MQPWLALLGHTLASRLWQDKTAIEIIEDVFADHAAIAAWRWDEGVADHVAQGLFARNGGQRSYCVQYRESDLSFVARLLAEEGICYRFEEDDTAPGGHQAVFFARSAAQAQDPTSANSLGGQGIRFHRSSSQEVQDKAQAGPAQVASKQTLELKTANGVVNIAAAKKIVLAVSGGASITIEGGNFTAQCPGKISVMAGQKSMVGGGTMSKDLPAMPSSICIACLRKSLLSAPAFTRLE